MQTRLITRSLVAATLALTLAACGEPLKTGTYEDLGEPNNNNNNVDEGEIALSQDAVIISALDAEVNEDYGDLDEGDEAPDFGDEELATEPDLTGEGEDVVDIINNPEEEELVEDLEGDPDSQLGVAPRKVVLAIVWGHMGPGAPEAPTDFSGSLSIENGALKVLRKLAFDANDEIIQPRTSYSEVSFTSHTYPHVDGLLVQAIMHPRLGTGVNGPAVITLDTAAYTGSITLFPGMVGNRIVPVDDQGNAVAIHAFLPDADGCANGLMGGRWKKLEDTADGRVLGRIKGRYISSDGQVRGKLRGVYGQRVNGSKVFFAKVIGHDGAFKGTLAGKYDNGRYRGRFLDTDHVVKGAVFGHYRAAPEGEKGLFRGRFSERCSELPGEGSIEPHDEYNDDLEDAVDALEDLDVPAAQ